MQRHRSQPVHGTLFSASEREHNVVLSASTSPMMRGEDLMVWEPEELNGYGGLGTGSEVRRDQRRPAARDGRLITRRRCGRRPEVEAG